MRKSGFALWAVVLCACGSEVNSFDGPSQAVVDGGTGGQDGATDDSSGGTSGTSGTGGTAGVGGDAGPDAPSDAGTGTVGAPCSNQGALACNGHAQKTILVCDGQHWVVRGECPGDELCDTRPAPIQGTCQHPVAVCIGHSPGDIVCDGASLHVCGPDLTTSTTQVCESPAHCQNATSGVCAACLPGEHRCEGANLMRCAANHLGFELQEQCASPQECNAPTASCTLCETAQALYETFPVDMYVMADRSGSMANFETPTRWENQSNALNAFFVDPASSGVGVALRFFPLDDNCGPQEVQCGGAAYATPLVAWADLPANVNALQSAIATTTPDGCFTPTQEALNGLLAGARNQKSLFPNHEVVGVIISDGEPCCGDCPVEDALGIGQIAASYANGTPPIRSFAISISPGATDVMTAIGTQGGGQVFPTSGAAFEIENALQEVRRQASPCSFPVPNPSTGPFDPNTVTATLLPNGAQPISVPRVPGAAQCTGLGWFFDGTQPTRLILCPDACAQLRNEDGTSLQVTAQHCP